MIWASRDAVSIAGCGAVSAYGTDWRTIDLRRKGEASAEIASDPRLARMASRGARLSVAAAIAACEDAGWTAPHDAGFFLGVGASGGSVDDLAALVAASVADGALSYPKFGTAGLRAANPLLAFQLMNNFTLCHAAIATGTRGPNLALFSRGARTIGAFVEAMSSIAEGECERALAGGADSALHPLTLREARVADPSEGAAIFALTRQRGIATLEAAAVAPVSAGWQRVLGECGVRPRSFAGVSAQASVIVLDSTGDLREGGLHWQRDALAATPALALAAGLAEIAARRADRVLVTCAGLDGSIGAAVISREAA